jgi:hypothetical protein
MLCIQLSKIFDATKNQKRNIKTLLGNICKGDFDLEIQFLLKKENRGYPCFLTLEEAKEKIGGQKRKIKEYQDTIDKVVKVRNKVYAHTDIDKIEDFPSFSEVKDLVDYASLLYNQTVNMIYGKNMDFTKGIINLTLKNIVRLVNTSSM